MLCGKQRGLEDRVVERLIEAPATMKVLAADLKAGGKQGPRAVYKAVGNLIRCGVLAKAGMVVRVDQEWARVVRNLVQHPIAPSLAPGERLAYRFTSLANLDAYWKTLVLGLEELEQDGQVFVYTPHNFWAYLPERKESEDGYYRHFAEQKVHAYHTVGGSTAADLAFKYAYQNQFLQIHAGHVGGLLRTDHLIILGDYVLNVRLPKGIAGRIDSFYASGRGVADFLPELVGIFETRTNIRLTLEHNGPKARKLKKRLSLPFYFWQS